MDFDIRDESEQLIFSIGRFQGACLVDCDARVLPQPIQLLSSSASSSLKATCTSLRQYLLVSRNIPSWFVHAIRAQVERNM